jgi:hypothetical protein
VAAPGELQRDQSGPGGDVDGDPVAVIARPSRLLFPAAPEYGYRLAGSPCPVTHRAAR